MPGTQKLGHHTPEFIEEFRRRALPREQYWIRNVVATHARILNIQRERPKTRTHQRRQRRAQDPKPPKSNKGPKNTDSAPMQKWVCIENDQIILDAITPGTFQRIRRSLAQLLRDQEEGKDPLDRLSTWSKNYKREVILFLIDQLDEKEVNTQKSRILFKFLATAQDTKTTPATSALPDIDTRSSQQDKRSKNKDVFWVRIPWSRHDFQTLKLDQLLRSKEALKLHPFADTLKRTKVSYSLNRPLGTFVSNITKVCSEVEGQDLPPLPLPTQCPCQQYKTEFSLCYDGHVVTTDPKLFKDPCLRQLWQCGRKFRVPAHPSVMLPDIKRGLDEYASRLARMHKVDQDKF